MPANTAPIFTLLGDLSADSGATFPLVMTTAANDFTGISANNLLIHTAGPNGAYIESIRFKARGANVASAVRVFLNNGSTPGTAANNFLWDDVALPATTASIVGQTGPAIILPMRLMLPPTWRIYAGLATTVAGGWAGLVVAGEY